MIQMNRKLLRQIQMVGLCVFVAGCQTGIDAEKVAVPVTPPKSAFEFAIDDTFPGFRPSKSHQNEAKSNVGKSSGHVKGDFNGDGLVDDALFISKDNKWKLAVVFQQSTGDYAVEEISTFPGKDSAWQFMPIERLHLHTVAAQETSADLLGFELADTSVKLEYSWHEKSRSFAASKIRDGVSTEIQPDAGSVDTGVTSGVATLFAQACQLDIDNHSIGDEPGADLMFSSGSGSMKFYTLNPIGKTKAMPFGKSKPGYDDCRSQQNVMSDGSLPEIEVGMHFCVETSEENIGHVWIDKLDLAADSITLGYQVWVSDH